MQLKLKKYLKGLESVFVFAKFIWTYKQIICYVVEWNTVNLQNAYIR